MAADRLLDILARLAEKGSTFPSSASLCEVATEVSDTSGAGIMLNLDGEDRGTLFSSDPISALIEELQFRLGEGPCIDAHSLGRPVLEPDLVHPVVPRWMHFTPRAVDGGARALFGFPLRVGAIRLGALNLYRASAGSLSDDEHADSLVVAGMIARTILSMQTGVTTGELSTQLESSANLRLAVHQASGMVSVQLDTTIADALLRMRAHAFRHDLTIDEVAAQVVDRRLRFDGPDDRDTHG
jgi:GAF domain-containing protein